MTESIYDEASAPVTGQVTTATSAEKPPSKLFSTGPTPSLTINTGHQPKRLLSPAPIGLPGEPNSSARRTLSPAASLTSGLPGQDGTNRQENGPPSTPKRPSILSRGLSLQLPGKEGDGSASVIKTDVRTPLTPKLDQAISYASPASLLPRRSRGMDFSRAATHLHHSTLAGNPDPESSPIIGSRGMSVPKRSGGSAYDSPLRGGNGSTNDQGMISSSVGSVSMLDSGSDSSTDDDVAMRDEDETIHMTPQTGRPAHGMSGHLQAQSPGGESLAPFTAASSGFMNYREKLRNRSKRKDSTNSSKRSSNGWRYDLFGSPNFGSPPIVRSIEGSETYFQRELTRKSIASRRESLSLGTDELSIDDPAQGLEDSKSPMDSFGITSANAEERRNVIKKAVTTRRSHLIPKTKGFARIRAALAEEGAPIDVENRREAEVIRQVKEREEHVELKHEDSVSSQPATGASSPFLAAATAGPGDSPPDDMSINTEAEQHPAESANTRRSSSSFSQQASRNGASTAEFWNRFLDDDRLRTPPPPLFPRDSSSVSAMSEDASMTLETSSTNTSIGPPLWPRRETSQQAQARNASPGRGRSNTPTTNLQADWSKKALGKRRREDELDTEFFKRRAVSPGLSSIAGSPVLPPSPAQREVGFWSINKGSGDSNNGGLKKEIPGGHVAGERVGSGSSESGRNNPGGRGVERRVGMQGMNEAGEGLMNMSID